MIVLGLNDVYAGAAGASSQTARPRLARVALIFFCSTCFALGNWQVVGSSDKPSPQPTVVYRHLDLEQTETGEHAILDLALFSSKACRLRVINNSEGASLSAAVEGSDYLAGVNGGYFDPDFAPLCKRSPPRPALTPASFPINFDTPTQVTCCVAESPFPPS